jgi:diguanylate cyclase (GGDEF)-like protein
MSGSNATRVLVVEDSPTQAVRVKRVLSSVGFEVEVASDGAEGLERFRAGRFDLVLSDVQMPGRSGYDLCRAIKADPRGRDVPVVLLTILSKPLDMIRGLECGADNYIYKPFQPDALVARIRTILANKQAREIAGPKGDGDVLFMGQSLKIAASKERILDFLGSAFEDFVHARHREYEGALAQEKQKAQAETYRVREELLEREKETLRRLHLFLQSTLDSLASRIAILDDSGAILAVNAAWRRLAATDPLLGRACGVGVNYLEECEASIDDRAADALALAAGIRDVIAGRRDEYCREYPYLGVEPPRWFSVRVTRFDDSGPVRVVVAHEDITQRKAAEEQLLHDAYHDALTGLPNRALFTDRLGRAIVRRKRNPDYRFAVLFLDLDGFKVINDSLGHMAGDQLLVAVGRRLSACIREEDTVARLGGDEFAILIHDIVDGREAIYCANRIQKDLGVAIPIAGHDVFTTASVGIALSTLAYERPVELLRDADTAMYRAKALGTSRHVVFDRDMHTSVVARLRLETDLRRALERQEFQVVYQPIIELDTGRIGGFEALVRWNHPERGLVSPAEFIPAAEETGLIIPIDLWVLREACRQLRAWSEAYRHAPPLVISANLSSKHFAQSDFIEQLDAILRETGLDPHSLRLEITESVILGSTESAIATLRQIQARGVSLSMDDFGTGYSSLSYLHKFPFNVLKIDRSFISRVGPAGENAEIVATIVALAHNLGMGVVAEGVETVEQFAQLRQLNCRYGQGFYFSRPVNPCQIETLLAAESRDGRRRLSEIDLVCGEPESSTAAG